MKWYTNREVVTFEVLDPERFSHGASSRRPSKIEHLAKCALATDYHAGGFCHRRASESSLDPAARNNWYHHPPSGGSFVMSKPR